MSLGSATPVVVERFGRLLVVAGQWVAGRVEASSRLVGAVVRSFRVVVLVVVGSVLVVDVVVVVSVVVVVASVVVVVGSLLVVDVVVDVVVVIEGLSYV